MSRKKSLITAATTFLAALGIGFVMQYGDAVASRFQPTPEPDLTLPEMVMPRQASMVLGLPEMVIPAPEVARIVLAALEDVEVPEVVAPLIAPEPVCGVEMSADGDGRRVAGRTLPTKCGGDDPPPRHDVLATH